MSDARKCVRCEGECASPGKLCDPCSYTHGDEYKRIDALETENARLRAVLARIGETGARLAREYGET